MKDKSIMPIGKYKGEKMANVPSGYLLWLYENGNILMMADKATCEWCKEYGY